MRFYSHGKLLITGEYAVLDGAQALCLPTKKGQSLEVEKNNSDQLTWISKDLKDNIWFQDEFKRTNSGIRSTTTIAPNESYAEVSRRVIQILNAAENISGLDLIKGNTIINKLEFDRSWGLGTSSTLINNIAQWAGIDPYKLLKETFKGSGYDIACAEANGPIVYECLEHSQKSLKVSFDPVFKNQLYFVYLNQKQNSREAIAHYRNQPKTHQNILIEKVSNITQQLLKCENLKQFELLIDIHENLISKIVDLPKVKTKLFPDFTGSIKSLGAWGGDFILVTSIEDPTAYFKSKGFEVVVRYDDMIL